MNLLQKALDVKIFDALPGECWRRIRIEVLPLLGFMPFVVLLVANALFMNFSLIDATWQLVLDQALDFALCLGLFSTGAACYKKFKTAMISAALRWIGSGRVGYQYISTIHAMMNFLNVLLQRMEIQSIQAVVRVRVALGIVHPSLFARLIPTPILRRA
ncbi:MAG: hypothetical protein KKG03_03685 [Gammaproteobacteria bacterium]|nr:hypothetical protein [Sideroxydans sp.]MBU3903791.1 hypothetical protein [Gammaproteobacteria bacterium]MBU4150733.1 hypothetical protein [Gammaproteobacteria bacterium]